MDNLKRLMIAVGIIHLVDGILLPILWGLGFLFVGTYYSPIAAPVWGGALFLIPAGILSLVVISIRKKKLLMTCWAFNLMGEVAVCIAGGATVYVLIADLNLSDELYIADVTFDILTIVLCGLEIVVCFIGVRGMRHAMGMLEEQPTQAIGTTVVCNAQGCDNPTMQQHPGQPAQVQIVGAPTQRQYPEQQGHYPGQQGHYPGQQEHYHGQQGHYPGQQEHYPGQQGLFPGQQEHYPGQQGLYPGQSGQHQYPKQYPEKPEQYHEPETPAQDQYPEQ